MSRPLRLEFPGALYHVTSRGNERKPIYLEESDFNDFLTVIEETCERYNWLIHAYCLMTNHYHLLIETPDGNLSRGMRHVNGVYTQRFNRKHRRVGHVFQGRFKGILVDKDNYLLEVGRYIVLNPVRAQDMVEDPIDWPWSSYRTMMGLESAPSWLSIDMLLSQFSENLELAISKYRQFVFEGFNDQLWDNLNHQVFLGDDDFVEKYQPLIKTQDGDLHEIPSIHRRAVAPELVCYFNEYSSNNKLGMAKAYATGQYTMSEIATVFGVHYSTVSRAIAQCKT